MPALTITIYPIVQGAKFDIDYLVNTHLPLAMKHWAPYGLLSYEVTQFSAFGAEQPLYHAQLSMEWERPECVERALQAPDSKVVLDNVPNFTSVMGVSMFGEVKIRK
ncbi:hypothetical protein K505DRAFT_370300 [Melanomma pulvis-pyrius CBS 109.77]|uniref:EthD domain-containing protein n=1 Tax=Melanomma pulvis-pyrius CBS 109.77 TaxID=1314802 RepID=A0A6A6XVY3_9PLEO|nr:hypothetical protein K505DRAFT_370300 [Melanomma pulvis-pyrius CBS 109.77]